MPFNISGDHRGLRVMSLKKVSIKVVQNHTVRVEECKMFQNGGNSKIKLKFIDPSLA